MKRIKFKALAPKAEEAVNSQIREMFEREPDNAMTKAQIDAAALAIPCGVDTRKRPRSANHTTETTMKNRIKFKALAPKSREEMESLVGQIAQLKLIERKTKAEMDEKLKLIREGYEGELAGITDKLALLMPHALAWAEAHPEEFGKAKSLEMLHGIVGWRLNNPSLKPLAGWTWKKVLDRLQQVGWLAYIRNTEEVNKQALLADREARTAEGLRLAGVRVVQDEEFFVEPKLTDTDKRETL